jgi:hypothetical protein
MSGGDDAGPGWGRGVAHDRGPLLFAAGERLELGGRDVRAGIAEMVDGVRGPGFIFSAMAHRRVTLVIGG